MSESTNSGEDRRGFMTQAGAIVVGSIVGLVPLVTAVCAALSPLFRKSKSTVEFVKVGMLDEVEPGGTPTRFTVRADRWDAWNFYPNEEVGGVYVRRPTPDETQCLTATCPHLGCSVAYDKASTEFRCPCHESIFNQQGKFEKGASPRNMDSLDVEVRDGKDGKEIWVKFEKFKAGLDKPIPQ